MTFADAPSGASLFIDANTFEYHFSPPVVFGPACTDSLDRITQCDIAGSNSLDVDSAGINLHAALRCFTMIFKVNIPVAWL